MKTFKRIVNYFFVWLNGFFAKNKLKSIFGFSGLGLIGVASFLIDLYSVINLVGMICFIIAILVFVLYLLSQLFKIGRDYSELDAGYGYSLEQTICHYGMYTKGIFETVEDEYMIQKETHWIKGGFEFPTSEIIEVKTEPPIVKSNMRDKVVFTNVEFLDEMSKNKHYNFIVTRDPMGIGERITIGQKRKIICKKLHPSFYGSVTDKTDVGCIKQQVEIEKKFLNIELGKEPFAYCKFRRNGAPVKLNEGECDFKIEEKDDRIMAFATWKHPKKGYSHRIIWTWSEEVKHR